MSEDNNERLLIGAVLAGYSDVVGLLARVPASDFDEPKLETIWRAIETVVEDGQPPEVSRVVVALGGEVQRLPGGATYLTDLFSESRRPESAEWYAERVTDAAARRRLLHLATYISQAVIDASHENVDAIAEEVRARLEKAAVKDAAASLATAADALPAVIDIAENGHPRGLTTPWDSIDRLTRGLPAGRLLIVGARPGVGKSVVGINLARHVAKVHQQRVFFASMEMSRVELTQRLVADHTGVDLARLDAGNVNDSGWASIHDKYAEIDALPIYFDDRGVQSIASIRHHVRSMANSDAGLGLVVVDYLQLLAARDSSRNRAEQVTEMSRGLKVMAREFNIPVVAMAQLNRGSAQRTNPRPTLTDLRESGGIEQDADIVMLMQRGGDDVEDLGEGQVRVYIDKNRSGPRGVATLDFWGHYARIEERTSWSRFTNQETA